jgi:Cupin
MRLKPGAIRELHWHKEAEWAYMLAGHCRITCIDPQGRNFIDDLGVGDLWNFRAGLPHSIQALSDGCEFLIVFDDGSFSENNTFLLTDWFHHTPLSVLAKNLGVSESALSGLPTAESAIIADPLIDCELRGVTSGGLPRLLSVLERLRAPPTPSPSGPPARWIRPSRCASPSTGPPRRGPRGCGRTGSRSSTWSTTHFAKPRTAHSTLSSAPPPDRWRAPQAQLRAGRAHDRTAPGPC